MKPQENWVKYTFLPDARKIGTFPGTRKRSRVYVVLENFRVHFRVHFRVPGKVPENGPTRRKNGYIFVYPKKKTSKWRIFDATILHFLFIYNQYKYIDR